MSELRGEVVFLRPLAIDDAERVNGWHNDASLYETLLGDMYGPTMDETRAWLAMRCAAHGIDELNYAVCLRDGGEHVGNLYIQDIDRASKVAKYQGIFLGAPGHRSRGVGREATALAIDHAMREFGLQRIWGDMLADNAPSLRAMEAVGFRVVDRLPANVTKDGRPRDVIRFAITAPSED